MSAAAGRHSYQPIHPFTHLRKRGLQVDNASDNTATETQPQAKAWDYVRELSQVSMLAVAAIEEARTLKHGGDEEGTLKGVLDLTFGFTVGEQPVDFPKLRTVASLILEVLMERGLRDEVEQAMQDASIALERGAA